MRIAIALLIVLGVVIILGAAGGTYYLAGNAQTNSAVKAVNEDIGKMNALGDRLDSLSSSKPALPDLKASGTSADFRSSASQFDGAVDSYLATLARASALVEQGAGYLTDAQKHVNDASASFLTMPQRDRLRREKQALGFEEQAIANARDLLAVAGKQLRAARSMVDAIAAYTVMGDKLDANDFAGAVAAYGPVHSDLADAATESQGAHIASIWDTMLADLNKLADDSRDAAQALVDQDFATAEAKGNAVEADAKALQNVDTSPLDSDTYLSDLAARIKSLESRASALEQKA